MPTPFQHLVYAGQVLSHPELPSRVSGFLTQHLGAFLLGTTAGDVQVITGQPRDETHFYRLSTGRDGSPVGKMLATFGSPLRASSPAHAAFLTGYAVHLVWDELWAWDIFVPYYRDGARWPDRKSFFVHHNALRVWLDRQAYARLRDEPGLSACLRSVEPDGWLPFAPDSALREWRDWLAAQLADPSLVQTAQVFADRMQVPVSVLEALVGEMAEGRYDVVPGLAEAIGTYEATALAESVSALLHSLHVVWDDALREPVSSASARLSADEELRDCAITPMLG